MANSRSVTPIAANTMIIGRPHLLAVHDRAQLRAVVVVADVDPATQQPHDEVLLLDVVVVVPARERLLAPRRPHEERAEDVEHPAELAR